MANTHNYGFRWYRSLIGQSTPQTLPFPVASTYQAATAGSTNVNLNIGDPIRLVLGSLQLTLDSTDNTGVQGTAAAASFGVLAGFPRGVTRGGVGPNSYLTGGYTYSGGIGGDAAPVGLIIPVAGNIFLIDADAVLGTPTRSGALDLVGQTACISYSVLTSGIGQPKANPRLAVSTLSTDGTGQGQLLIVGVGGIDQDQDYTASGVTFQVMFTFQQMALNANTLYGVPAS